MWQSKVMICDMFPVKHSFFLSFFPREINCQTLRRWGSNKILPAFHLLLLLVKHITHTHTCARAHTLAHSHSHAHAHVQQRLGFLEIIFRVSVSPKAHIRKFFWKGYQRQ